MTLRSDPSHAPSHLLSKAVARGSEAQDMSLHGSLPLVSVFDMDIDIGRKG